MLVEQPQEDLNTKASEVPASELAHYRFDTSWFEEREEEPCELTAWATFRLQRVGMPLVRPKYLYLILYNCHNGYYGHGFEAKQGEADWQSGCI